MVIHWEHLSLSVQVSQRGPLVAASGDPEGRVLNGLEGLAGCSLGVGEPDRGSIHEERPYKCLKGKDYGLLLLAPVCTCERSKNFEAVCRTGGYCLDVVAEGEVGVKRHAQNSGVTVEGKWGAVEGDVWVEMRLASVGGEEGDV